MEVVSIAIVLPEDGEEAKRLIEEARHQSWGKKEILVAVPRKVGAGAPETEDLRRIPVGEGADAREELLRSARGAWIQWLREGERLAPHKIELQLREAEASRWDLLCSPYRLRMSEIAPVIDPRKEPLSYVRRLGAEFPFSAPLLWSARALRLWLRDREGRLAGVRIGLGGEARVEGPEGRAPTRGEWRASLSWALVLAAAAGDLAERDRLFGWLREIDAGLARRLAERLGARELLVKAAPKSGFAGWIGRTIGPEMALRTEGGMLALRQAERVFRRGRQRFLRQMGLRKKPILSGRWEADWAGYGSWIAAYQMLDETDREAIRGEIGRFPRRPLLSVVLPVFNTPEKWLQRAIDSIREQLYPDWELCLADDGSTASHIRPLLERNREAEARIRVVFRPESGGIAAASNSALALARGEWIVLVDHDDELPEDAFYRVVREILRDPEVRLLYSDEDKIDEAGRRFDPYFKPDFSHDLLLSENCISHLGVYQAALLRSLGGFRRGYDGSQDYDLALRFIEVLQPHQIHHIPRILYHWRTIATSAAVRVDAKPYAYEAARKAIREHLGRMKIPGDVLPTQVAWAYRVRRTAPDLSVSVLLGNGSSGEGLRKAVETLRSGTDFPAYELLVIGRSAEGLPEGVRLLDPGALAGPALWNWAAGEAKGEVLVFLASPVEPRRGWLGELVSQAARPEVGAVGGRILTPEGTVAEAGVVIGLDGGAGAAFRGWSGESIGYFGQAILIRNPSAVSAACLATRREVFAESGGFDEGYRRELWDIDYCLRLGEKGYRVVFTPYAELVRVEIRREASPEDRERFRERWTRADPAYNPNLSLEAGYGLAWPPRVGRNRAG